MDIVSRLKQFITFLNIPVTQFADSCNIARPTLSQLLNGRNKKVSDEFIGKIHDAYPTLSIIWLLFGEGEMLFNSKGSEGETPLSSPKRDLGFFDLGAQKANRPINDSPTGANIDFAENIPSQNSSAAPRNDYERFSQKENGGNQTHIADKAPQANLPFDAKNIEFEKPADSTMSLFGPSCKENTDASTGNQEINPTETGKKGTPSKPHGDSQQLIFNDVTPPAPQDGIKKRIVNIIVYYDDNSFEAFVPKQR